MVFCTMCMGEFPFTICFRDPENGTLHNMCVDCNDSNRRFMLWWEDVKMREEFKMKNWSKESRKVVETQSKETFEKAAKAAYDELMEKELKAWNASYEEKLQIMMKEVNVPPKKVVQPGEPEDF